MHSAEAGYTSRYRLGRSRRGRRNRHRPHRPGCGAEDFRLSQKEHNLPVIARWTRMAILWEFYDWQSVRSSTSPTMFSPNLVRKKASTPANNATRIAIPIAGAAAQNWSIQSGRQMVHQHGRPVRQTARGRDRLEKSQFPLPDHGFVDKPTGIPVSADREMDWLRNMHGG